MQRGVQALGLQGGAPRDFGGACHDFQPAVGPQAALDLVFKRLGLREGWYAYPY